MKKVIRDHFSKPGAQDLAKQIMDYWYCRGYEVKAWVEEIRQVAMPKTDKGKTDRIKIPPDDPKIEILYAVRSNLINGKPPSAAVKLAA